MATKQNPTTPKRCRPPARTAAARANQLKAAAFALAEERIADGTASNQLVVQCLKLDPEREELERVRLANENSLLDARVGALKSGQRLEELYTEALEAVKAYRADDADV